MRIHKIGEKSNMDNLFYINQRKKRIVGRNNQQISNPLVIDYNTVEDISFQIINDNNQIQTITDSNGLYLAGSIGMSKERI